MAFTGGAGVADWWLRPHRGRPAWRDTMARLEGPIVAALQGVFAENWLECCGEIMTGPETYKPHARVGDVAHVGAARGEQALVRRRDVVAHQSLAVEELHARFLVR